MKRSKDQKTDREPKNGSLPGLCRQRKPRQQCRNNQGQQRDDDMTGQLGEPKHERGLAAPGSDGINLCGRRKRDPGQECERKNQFVAGPVGLLFSRNILRDHTHSLPMPCLE